MILQGGVIKDQWTQREFLDNKKILNENNVDVYLIDTILETIEGMDTTTYNPHQMSNIEKESVFVFYCYSGKTTLKRLGEYKKKFPKHHCISLKGGKSYWDKSMK